MAGAPHGGAELFYERLVLAQHRAGDTVLAAIRTDAARAARLAAAPCVQLPFGGAFDLSTRSRLRVALTRFAPRVAVAWMNRAARFAPKGGWVLVGRLGGYYDLRYYRHCDHLVGNTRALAQWITAEGWPAARTHYLPNFAPDLHAARPDRLGIPPGRRIVLALGRLHANKAFDVLIRALPHLPGTHAVIAGEGPERAGLEALARQLGVADRVLFPGWREDTAGLLAAADVLACPSRHEPLGNVVVEAWSAGRPVVAASASGPRELIRPGEDGLLVPPEDVEALATSLRLVLENGSFSARLAESGRARYLAEFAEAPVLAQWRGFLAAVEKPACAA